MKHTTLIGSLYAASGTIAVGGAVAALSLLVDYPYLAGQAIRYALGAVILLILLGVQHRALPRLSGSEMVQLLCLALTGLVGFNLCLLFALERAEPATVGVMVGCVPIILALAGPLLERRVPSTRVLGAAAIVTLGAGIVQGAGATTLVGILFALGALAGEASFSLLAVPLVARLGPLALSAYVSALASVLLAGSALMFDGLAAFPAPTLAQSGAFAFLGLAVTAGATLAWYSAMPILGVDRTGLFAGLIPISTLLSSVLVGTGTVTPLRVVGATLVGVGVMVGLSRSRARAIDPVLNT